MGAATGSITHFGPPSATDSLGPREVAAKILETFSSFAETARDITERAGNAMADFDETAKRFNDKMFTKAQKGFDNAVERFLSQLGIPFNIYQHAALFGGEHAAPTRAPLPSNKMLERLAPHPAPGDGKK